MGKSAQVQLVPGVNDDVLAGAFAGLVARLTTAPFDFLKIRFQLQVHYNLPILYSLAHLSLFVCVHSLTQAAESAKYTNLLQAVKSVIKEEGFLSLWKGNLSATYLWITYAMIQFSVYGMLKRFGESIQDPFERKYKNDNDLIKKSMRNMHEEANTVRNSMKIKPTKQPKNRFWNTFVLFLAGAGAGMTATAMTYPLDIMRTHFALQGNVKTLNTMSSFVAHTMKNQGFRGFYSGCTPALVGITPYMGLNFAIYETLTKFTDFNDNGSGAQGSGAQGSILKKIFRKGVCGAVAGGTSKFLVYPLDTIKKQMQMKVLQTTVDGCSKFPVYKNMYDCFITILRRDGIRGFYKGIAPTTLKSVFATAVTFAAYESAKDFIELHKRKESCK
jgi:solute carrier family 25 thiamine pyrophosphate transporter 19